MGLAACLVVCWHIPALFYQDREKAKYIFHSFPKTHKTSLSGKGSFPGSCKAPHNLREGAVNYGAGVPQIRVRGLLGEDTHPVITGWYCPRSRDL